MVTFYAVTMDPQLDLDSNLFQFIYKRFWLSNAQ